MKRMLFPYTAVLAAASLVACAGPEGGEAPPEVARDAEAVPAVPAASVSERPVETAAPAPAPEGAPAPSGTPRETSSVPAAAPQAPAAAAEPTEATPVMQSDAEAILRRAERAYEGIRSMEADFAQEVTVPLLGSTQRSRGKIYHRRPDRFLMRFTQPEGDVVVADGQYLWMYYPSTDPKQVLRTRIANTDQQVDLQKEFLSNATERYGATRAGTESVAGRAADVLVLTPRGASPYRRVRIWVDRQDDLVRRFEIVEENESVRRLELRGLKPNAQLSDQLFRFTPPPGAQIFEQ